MSVIHNIIGGEDEVLYVTGWENPGDGIVQGLYKHHQNSTATPDGWNIVKTTPVDDINYHGRWFRCRPSEIYLPQGKLVPGGKTKQLYASATIDSNGEATINLTMDDTTNGDAIFTAIDYINVCAQTNAASAVEVPWGCVKALANSNKQLTVKFADAVVLAILGATAANKVTGTAIKIQVIGE